MTSSLLSGSHDAWRQRLRGRVVVVSPHSDDAVMSMGATIAWAAQAGAKIEILTVFSLITTSTAPAGPWDQSCGFDTEGEASILRREEDRQACRILGATPRWLEFGAEPYERRGTDEDICYAVQAATEGAGLVLIPGFPLLHPDHAYLSELLLRKGLGGRRTVLYTEQPYAYTHKMSPQRGRGRVGHSGRRGRADCLDARAHRARASPGETQSRTMLPHSAAASRAAQHRSFSHAVARKPHRVEKRWRGSPDAIGGMPRAFVHRSCGASARSPHRAR